MCACICVDKHVYVYIPKYVSTTCSIHVMLLECMCSGLTVWHWVESTRLSLAQAIYPALDIPQFPALWAFLSFSMFVVVALVQLMLVRLHGVASDSSGRCNFRKWEGSRPWIVL